MKTQFLSQYKYKGPTGQKFTQPSQTVPDQIMTIQQIMDRYARGLPLAGAKVPIYEDEETQDLGLPDMSRMDAIEKIETLRAVEQQLRELKSKYPIKTAPPPDGGGGGGGGKPPENTKKIE